MAAASARNNRDARLRRHADYQRVYQASRKHFSSSMSYFYALRSDPAASRTSNDQPTAAEAAKPASPAYPTVPPGPRVGLTAGRVLGKAVDRNRIKRRMREAVRKHIGTLASDVDVILHPRKFVITLEYAKLESEVGRIFATVQSALTAPSALKSAAQFPAKPSVNSARQSSLRPGSRTQPALKATRGKSQ